jgi:hypothetical protein
MTLPGVPAWACWERGMGHPPAIVALIPVLPPCWGTGRARTRCPGVFLPRSRRPREELATVKAVVTSLEEDAALARSQQMESDCRWASERSFVSAFCLLVDMMSNNWHLFWAELLTEVESLRSAANILRTLCMLRWGARRSASLMRGHWSGRQSSVASIEEWLLHWWWPRRPQTWSSRMLIASWWGRG